MTNHSRNIDYDHYRRTAVSERRAARARFTQHWFPLSLLPQKSAAPLKNHEVYHAARPNLGT